MGELFDDSHTKPKAAKPDSAIQEALPAVGFREQHNKRITNNYWMRFLRHRKNRI